MQQPPDHDERNARYGLHFHYGHSHRPFTAVVDTDGAVLAAGWTAQPEGLLPLIAPGLRPASVVHRTDLGAVTTAVVTYHRGDLTAICDVPVRQRGGEILEHAWQVLRAVRARALVVPCHRATDSRVQLSRWRCASGGAPCRFCQGPVAVCDPWITQCSSPCSSASRSGR